MAEMSQMSLACARRRGDLSLFYPFLRLMCRARKGLSRHLAQVSNPRQLEPRLNNAVLRYLKVPGRRLLNFAFAARQAALLVAPMGAPVNRSGRRRKPLTPIEVNALAYRLLWRATGKCSRASCSYFLRYQNMICYTCP